MVRYLEDGRLELSNNRAERSIKPFVMGRKNWLFANTPAGAQSSAVIYSLIETASDLYTYGHLPALYYYKVYFYYHRKRYRIHLATVFSVLLLPPYMYKF